MRATIANLTAFLLIVHAMIGCCHHHWQFDQERAAANPVATCSCCEHHCATQESADESPVPCDGREECHGVCTYLPTQRVDLDVLAGGNDFDIATAIPTHSFSPAATSDMVTGSIFTLDDSPPPLRLNLLHQILLI
jgi:hypothetical protein